MKPGFLSLHLYNPSNLDLDGHVVAEVRDKVGRCKLDPSLKAPGFKV